MNRLFIPLALISALLSAGCDTFNEERPLVSKISSKTPKDGDAGGKKGSGGSDTENGDDPVDIGEENGTGENPNDIPEEMPAKCMLPEPATETF